MERMAWKLERYSFYIQNTIDLEKNTIDQKWHLSFHMLFKCTGSYYFWHYDTQCANQLISIYFTTDLFPIFTTFPVVPESCMRFFTRSRGWTKHVAPWTDGQWSYFRIPDIPSRTIRQTEIWRHSVWSFFLIHAQLVHLTSRPSN